MTAPTFENSNPPAAAIRQRVRLFGVLALLLALVIFGFGVLPGLAGDTGDWVATPCTVLESQVEARQESEPWGNSTRLFTVYVPYIRYTYEFAGAQYESDLVSRHGSDSQRDPERARQIVAAFPPESTQTCYVNPDAPHEAVLLARDTHAPWLYALGGGILAVFGVGALLLSPRKKR